jgi:hypothetical protein
MSGNKRSVTAFTSSAARSKKSSINSRKRALEIADSDIDNGEAGNLKKVSAS